MTRFFFLSETLFGAVLKGQHPCRRFPNVGTHAFVDKISWILYVSQIGIWTAGPPPPPTLLPASLLFFLQIGHNCGTSEHDGGNRRSADACITHHARVSFEGTLLTLVFQHIYIYIYK